MAAPVAAEHNIFVFQIIGMGGGEGECPDYFCSLKLHPEYRSTF